MRKPHLAGGFFHSSIHFHKEKALCLFNSMQKYRLILVRELALSSEWKFNKCCISSNKRLASDKCLSNKCRTLQWCAYWKSDANVTITKPKCIWKYGNKETMKITSSYGICKTTYHVSYSLSFRKGQWQSFKTSFE